MKWHGNLETPLFVTMAERHVLAEQNNLTSVVLFYFKTSVLITLRFFKNVFLYNVQKFRLDSQLTAKGVIAVSETELWSGDDDEKNWVLTAGKVQNLRTAARKLNGIEVPADQTFSFWSHVGKPSKRRGYVVGREIREGCIVPTIAGGLCQLSNALYDAAIKAGFEIIERHRHTKVIRGSLAEVDRDATIKWNYIDLCFRSKHAFRIEIEITAEKLIVKFRSAVKSDSPESLTSRIPSAKLNDCFSCGNFECFKHPDRSIAAPRKAMTTFILDEKWTEYERYISIVAQREDHFIIPFVAGERFRIGRYTWSVPNKRNTSRVPLTTFYRSLYLKIFVRTKGNIFSMMLGLDQKIAKRMIKYIPVESTHIVISQNLLPFAWTEGVLGGRTFDVLMTRLPIEKLHERLDMAFEKFPDSSTLNDFRSPDDLINAENAALTKARHIVTPHQEIADLFNNKSVRLDWNCPKKARSVAATGTKILFPASALGRKGAYEIRRLAKELNLSIRLIGNAVEYESFWNGISVEKTKSDPFEDVQIIIYPTYVEHQPRFLLRAIAAGLPVITTTAAGLPEMPDVSILPTGDYDALRKCVEARLEKLNH